MKHRLLSFLLSFIFVAVHAALENPSGAGAGSGLGLDQIAIFDGPTLVQQQKESLQVEKDRLKAEKDKAMIQIAEVLEENIEPKKEA